jgi:hypothetical protein
LKKVVIVGGAVLVTAVLAGIAFWLGAVGFDVRRFSEHQGRLRRLADKKPKAELVLRAFKDEGTLLVASPRGPEEIQRLARERGGPRAAEIEQKASQWARTEVFAAGDVLYLVYFDSDGVMRDFTVVDRR